MKQKAPETPVDRKASQDIVIKPNRPHKGYEETQTHSERIDIPLGKLANPVKHIGVSSQNFRTVTGHAGKARRFLLYETSGHGQVREAGRLDLPKIMSMHEFHGEDHPLFELDVVITAGCGDGFIRRMYAKGVTVIATSETDPARAAELIAAGKPLSPAAPHEH